MLLFCVLLSQASQLLATLSPSVLDYFSAACAFPVADRVNALLSRCNSTATAAAAAPLQLRIPNQTAAMRRASGSYTWESSNSQLWCLTAPVACLKCTVSKALRTRPCERGECGWAWSHGGEVRAEVGRWTNRRI